VFGRPDILIKNKETKLIRKGDNKETKKTADDIVLTRYMEDTQELDDALMRVKLDFDKT
jgi:hypothetical protein